MDMAIIFMLVASAAPFVFIHLKKYVFAAAQVLLLIGMWMYFFAGLNPETLPAPFSVLWFSFYGSLVLSEIGYVMFVIYLGKTIGAEYRQEHPDSNDPISEL
ncbi:MAG TPA: hypothetical protein VFK44_07255 [Bacillales bacterium]|nr:hypothetical protein [Bacillales bacterium]